MEDAGEGVDEEETDGEEAERSGVEGGTTETWSGPKRTERRSVL